MGQVGNYLNQIEPVFKKILDFEPYKIFLKLNILEILINIIVLIVITIPLFIYLLFRIGLDKLLNPMVYSHLFDPMLMVEIILFSGFLLLMLILVMSLIGALFAGARFEYAHSFLEGNKKSLGESIAAGKKNLLNIFFVSLIWSVIKIILLVLLMAPGIIMLLGILPDLAVNSANAFPMIMTLVVYTVFAIFIFLAFTVIISPFVTMAVPIVVFEKLGPIQSFKRGFGIVKGVYIANLVFLILVGVFIFAIGLIPGLIMSIFDIIIQILVGFSAMVNPLLAVFFVGIYMLIYVAMHIITTSFYEMFSYCSITTLYVMNSSKNPN
jgi:hypothetical protein